MKKNLLFILLSVLFIGCSDDDTILLSNETKSFKKLVSEKYDGEIMKFENNEDFIEFYDLLTMSTNEEYKDFLMIKENNQSIYYEEIFNEEEEEEDDIIKNNSQLIISEYLASIFNKNNQIRLKNNLITLTEDGNLVNELNEIVGTISNSNFNQGHNNYAERHNVNHTKSWSLTQGDRRITFAIYNETIYISGIMSSTKLFYRTHKQYKSCSFWRCTWKNDNGGGFITPSLAVNGICGWSVSDYNSQESVGAVFTKMIASYNFMSPCALVPITVTGTANFQSTNVSGIIYSINYDYDPY